MISKESIINGEIQVVKLNKRETASADNYFVTIPLTIIKALGWEKGIDLLVQKEGEKVVIEKVVKKE